MGAGGNPPAMTLLLIGCGKMGGALLKGWLKRGTARHVVVVEPGTGADAFAGDRLVERRKHPQEVPLEFAPDVVVFAVKPQVMDGAVSPYKRFVGRSLFLSIAAGKTLRYFARLLDDDAAVVRAMPNTPAAVGRGITVATANPRVTPTQRRLADTLLSAVGEVGWVEDEALIDAVTAVSGSGPAYVFLLIECMAKAGVTAGLPPELAGRVHFQQGDASRLPYDDASFNLVGLANMIPFFDELARVLAAGGGAIVAFSSGSETPIYVATERLRRELEPRGFTDFAEFSAGSGTALLARKGKRD